MLELPLHPLAMMLLHSRLGLVTLFCRGNSSAVYIKLSGKIWGGKEVSLIFFNFENFYLDDKKLKSILLTLRLMFFYEGKFRIKSS